MPGAEVVTEQCRHARHAAAPRDTLHVTLPDLMTAATVIECCECGDRQRQHQDTGTRTEHGSRKLRCHEILNLLIEFHNSPAAAAPHLASWWRPAVPGVDAAAAVNDTGHSSQLIYSQKNI